MSVDELKAEVLRLDPQTRAYLARELLASLADAQLEVIMLDVRDEADYNLFHIRDARHIHLAEVTSLVPDLLTRNANNTIIVVMSNDETAATDAWRFLVANSIPNVYILEGGINNWLSVFGGQESDILPISTSVADDQLRYTFLAALGDHYLVADPKPYEWNIQYTPRIQLQRQRSPSGGGCG